MCNIPSNYICQINVVDYVSQPCTVNPTLLLLHVPPPFRSARSALLVNLTGRERSVFSLCVSPTAEAQKVYTFINIMLCAYMLCVMEGALPPWVMYMNEWLLHREWLLPRKSTTVLSRNRV